MSTLSGRMLQIVSGTTDLSIDEVEKYRTMLEGQGYDLPEFVPRSQMKTQQALKPKPCGVCGKKKKNLKA